MRLKQALDVFLGEYKASTQLAYGSVLLPLIDAFGARRRVRDISAIDLIQYVQEIKASDRADATIHKHIKTIKVFFNWLEKAGAIDSDQNPARPVRQVRVHSLVRKSKAMTDNELHSLLAVVYGNPREYAIVSFIADTGCRAGGAANLLRVNLDLENLTAQVTEKGDKTRAVWFGQPTADALAVWLDQRPAVDHDYVFCHAHGPYTSAAISQMIRRACLRAGLRSLGAHSMRHRFAHSLARQGTPITITQKAMGHDSWDTTAKYYYPDGMDEVASVVKANALTDADMPVHQPSYVDDKKIIRFKRS